MVLDNDIDTANIFGKEIEALPISAQLAFAVRCIRRTQPLFSGSATHAPRIIQGRVLIPREHIDVMNRSLDAIQQLAEKIHGGETGPDELPADDIDAVYRASYSIIIRNPKGAAYSDYAFAVFSVNKACQAALRGNEIKAIHFLRNALMSSLNSAANYYGGEGKNRDAANRAFQYTKSLARNDFNLLIEAAREGNWSKDASVPAGFFSVHSVFDADVLIGSRKITGIAHLIEERLRDASRRDPEIARDLHERYFKELIADLFSGFGFDVELNCKTRDVARCILAIKNQLARVQYLMECRRRAPGDTLDLAVAHRLRGVLPGDGPPRGVVASVSRITGDAAISSWETDWLLETRELDRVFQWLGQYQKRRLTEILFFNGAC
ncbi:MAG: restriction endonuclease [Desulfobacterales bacterium]|nr:restriction endonuclease [Desulfobacterales bacterium]